MPFLIVGATLMVAIVVVVMLKIHDAEEISFKLKGKRAKKELCAHGEDEGEKALARRE